MMMTMLMITNEYEHRAIMYSIICTHQKIDGDDEDNDDSNGNLIQCCLIINAITQWQFSQYCFYSESNFEERHITIYNISYISL